MLWKRILLLSIFFFILTVSLVYYYALPKMLEKPLRMDAVPSGAYLIPWMRPNPSIAELNQNPQMNSAPTFDVDAVMAGALKLDMTFQIDTPGGKRVVPSTVYLGHDTDHLYVGGKFVGMGLNPASDPPGPDPRRTVPNTFQILFDVYDSGVLRFPESGSRLDMYADFDGRVHMWISHDVVWVYLPEDGRSAWIMADNVPGLKGEVSIRDMIAQYDNSTETLTMLFSRFLSMPNSLQGNALQMRSGECWVMGFLIELGFTTNTAHFGDYVDGWPKKAYPYLSDDSSWWPKLAIDLSNPPSQYSTKSPEQSNQL